MGAAPTTAIQFNIKAGNDLINIYCDSVAEAEDLLDAILDSTIPQKYHDVQTHMGAINAIATTLTPSAPAAPAPAAAAAPGPYPGAASAPAAAASPAPMCDHGMPAKLVPGGISKKTNRPYPAFYACSQPRESQCGFRQTAE